MPTEEQGPALAFGLFTDPLEEPDPIPPRPLIMARRAFEQTQTGNTVDEQLTSITALRLVWGEKEPDRAGDSFCEAHEELPPDDERRTLFHSDNPPKAIAWEVESPGRIRKARLELFMLADGAPRLLWTKTMEWDDDHVCPPEGETPFDGTLADREELKAATGAKAVTIEADYDEEQLPEGQLAAEHGPYKLKMTLEQAEGLVRFIPCRWLYFDVRSWLEFELVYEDGTPIPERYFRVEAGSGRFEGRLNEDGASPRVTEIAAGEARIVLPWPEPEQKSPSSGR